MDCKELRELLDLYIDGELSAAATGEARVHLTECASCARTEAQLRRLRGMLKRAVLRHEPPPELEAEVLRSVRSRRRVARAEGGVAEPGGRARNLAAVWRARVNLPLPVLTLLIAALIALGGRAVFFSRQAPEPGASKAARREPQSAPAPPGEFDFSRFYRGERASIEVVRRASADGARR